MIKEAIEKILDLAQVAEFTSDGRDFTDKKVYQVPRSMPTPLVFGTLYGLVTYLKDGPDGLTGEAAKKALLLHVTSETGVGLVGPMNTYYKDREQFAGAQAVESDGAAFEFERYYSPDEFVTKLQSQFTMSDDLSRLLAIAGNLTSEAVSTSVDDGITQQVATRKGIHLQQRAEIKNPFALAPFRTFREITQPTSPFIFRVKQSGQNEPACALFEADGGAWKIAAMVGIEMELKRLLDGAGLSMTVVR